MVQILTDADVVRSCTASRAVRVMRQAIAAHAEGRLAAPPRAYTQLETGPMVYTAGGLRKRVHGVRIYDYAGSEQAVAVWNDETGRLAALAIGDELGRRRTGAIGAVAIDTLARPDASTLGIVGTGDQAWAQIWAATAVRHWRRVVVYGRRFSAREAFAARCRDELLVDAVAVDSAERAVRGRDVVIIATNSSTPVIDMNWITAGTHVTTLGPKSVTAHEMPLDLADRADLLVTDSLAQVSAYPEPYALPIDQMVELGAVLAGKTPGRLSRDQITVFCSVGLAGTEVILAADLAGVANETPRAEVRTQRHRAAPMDEAVDELGPEAVIPAASDLAAASAAETEPADVVMPAVLAQPGDEDRAVKREIAAELRAAVAELASIPQPRVPAGDAETDAGAEDADTPVAATAADTGKAAATTDAGEAGTIAPDTAKAGTAKAGAAKPGAEKVDAGAAGVGKPAVPDAATAPKPSELPQRRAAVPLPPGVRSAKDILAAAGQGPADADAAGPAQGPDADASQDAEHDEEDSLKTLDEIFAFSELQAIADRPAPEDTAPEDTAPEDEPAADKPTADKTDADTTAADATDETSSEKAADQAAPDQAATDSAQSNGTPAEPMKQPPGKAPGERAGQQAPAAKVVTRRDTARVAGSSSGRNRGSGGRSGGTTDRSGGPHRDRPTGSDNG